jgi:FHS family L-fucose permease-like MFS transporter
MNSYLFYLFAIYVMAGGCSVLETTANPYIMMMGTRETATRRLNIAQIFNPIGSLAGILISGQFILSELSQLSSSERSSMSADALRSLQHQELSAVTGTYMALGIILLFILVVMLFAKMPHGGDSNKSSGLRATFKRLSRNKVYRYGVIAQFFYIGAQIGVWSFTIRYVMNELNMHEQNASTIYLYSIICFTVARFIFTALMKYFQPSKLLTFSAACAIIACVSVICNSGMLAIISLIAVSFFMSLMFPTIYGIALGNVGGDMKIGASGLIMAILGGAVLTPVQGYVSDLYGVNISYIIPLICFVVVAIYGMYTSTLTQRQ